MDGANLTDANLEDADLQDAKLFGIRLGGANLKGANLRNTHLEGVNLRGTQLQGTWLDGVLTDINLEEADLQEAKLFNTRLERANLKETRNDRDLTSDFDDHRYPRNFETFPSAIPESVPGPLFLFVAVLAFLEEDETAFVGGKYSVQAGISQHRPPVLQEERTVFPVDNIIEPILFDTSLHTSQNIELTTEWYKSLSYDLQNFRTSFC